MCENGIFVLETQSWLYVPQRWPFKIRWHKNMCSKIKNQKKKIATDLELKEKLKKLMVETIQQM